VKITKALELLRTILREEGDIELVLPNDQPCTSFTTVDGDAPVLTYRHTHGAIMREKQPADRPGWTSQNDLRSPRTNERPSLPTEKSKP
jgi:hypothetical protein